MQRDEVVIQDIINAARLVIEFVKGFDKDTFILFFFAAIPFLSLIC